MKKKLYLIVSTILLAIILTSCNFNSQKLIELQNEVRYLETEVSSLKASPGFSFGEAFEYIDAGDYGEAVKILKELQVDFPEWNKRIVTNFIDEYSALASESN